MNGRFSNMLVDRTKTVRCLSWMNCIYHALVLDSQLVNQINEET